MKSRTLIVVLFVVSMVAVVIWWMRQPSAEDSGNVAIAPKTEVPPPVTTTSVQSKIDAAKFDPATSPIPPKILESKSAGPNMPNGIVTPSAAIAPPAVKITTAGKGLHFALEPENGSANVLADVKGRFARLFPGTKVDPNTLQARLLYARYILSADAVLNGEGLAAAQATGVYDYVIETPGAPFSVAIVNASGTTLSSGGIKNEVPALVKLASLDQVLAGSYEPRFLIIPPSGRSNNSNSVIWLKSDAGGADLIYPVIYPPTGIQAGKLYTADEFLAILLPLLQQRLTNPPPQRMPGVTGAGGG